MEPGGPVAVVVTGGDPIDPATATDLPPGALVVAADAGLDHALRLGLDVDVAVGDFDSVGPGTLAAAEAGGCEVERHPVAKDRTDLELALLAARARGARRILVLGGHGGRLDHLVANVAVLSMPALASVPVEARMGPARLYLARPHLPVGFDAVPGELVTLLATGGRARRVRTHGLRYRLRGEDLGAGSSRGVSNEVVSLTVTVEVESGAVLVIRPDAGRGPQPAGAPSGR
ncbi:MAG TPA: thiamine diphosphokinase [Acidimicrobiales bacterium]|nr:thiamine diphosphokinase [Acidimicrobiales bacterium]